MNVPADALETLLRALVAVARDELVVLPGVGWLGVKRYKAYAGRSPQIGAPERRLPSFMTDPDLRRALVGLPPSGRSFATERARYQDAIDPDDADGDGDAAEEGGPVTRTPGAELIAEAIRLRLCAGDAADIPGLGVFDVLEKPALECVDPRTGNASTIPARRVVRFLVAEALTERLNPRP